MRRACIGSCMCREPLTHVDLWARKDSLSVPLVDLMKAMAAPPAMAVAAVQPEHELSRQIVEEASRLYSARQGIASVLWGAGCACSRICLCCTDGNGRHVTPEPAGPITLRMCRRKALSSAWRRRVLLLHLCRPRPDMLKPRAICNGRAKTSPRQNLVSHGGRRGDEGSEAVQVPKLPKGA